MTAIIFRFVRVDRPDRSPPGVRRRVRHPLRGRTRSRSFTRLVVREVDPRLIDRLQQIHEQLEAKRSPSFVSDLRDRERTEDGRGGRTDRSRQCEPRRKRQVDPSGLVVQCPERVVALATVRSSDSMPRREVRRALARPTETGTAKVGWCFHDQFRRADRSRSGCFSVAEPSHGVMDGGQLDLEFFRETVRSATNKFHIFFFFAAWEAIAPFGSISYHAPISLCAAAHRGPRARSMSVPRRDRNCSRRG